jgi:aminodeoxyfutalosine synthase
METVTTLQSLAERVSAGGAIQAADAAVVMASHDLIAIGMMADEVRRQLHGPDTTFVRVLELHTDAVPDALPGSASPGEVRLVGSPASLSAACAAVERARRIAAAVPLTGYTIGALAGLAASGGDVWRRLKDAGLDGIAEVVADGARAAADAVEQARSAGLFVYRITVHEAPADPLGGVLHASSLQHAVGGFRAFAPLPRVMSTATPTTGFDDVKLVAAARLVLRDIPSIQVDWPLYGPKLAQVALTVGGDDVDGVAAVESGLLGTRRSAIEEIRGNIRAAGLQPVERDGAFTLRVAASSDKAG